MSGIIGTSKSTSGVIGRSKDTPKVWFAGSSSGSYTEEDSYNVSSWVDNGGNGLHRLNFIKSFQAVAYTFAGACQNRGVLTINERLVGSVDFRSFYDGNTDNSYPQISVVCFGE